MLLGLGWIAPELAKAALLLTLLATWALHGWLPEVTNIYIYIIIKESLGGETSVLRTFGMSGKELVKERVSEGKWNVRERVSQRKS